MKLVFCQSHFRVEENGQTMEIIEEDGRIKSKKINGVLQSIQ